MKNFGIGLAGGIAGFAMWVASSIVAGMAEFASLTQPWFGEPLMIVGFCMMLLAPLTFWVILPIVKLLRR